MQSFVQNACTGIHHFIEGYEALGLTPSFLPVLFCGLLYLKITFNSFPEKTGFWTSKDSQNGG